MRINWKNKKITIIGLGLLGRGVGDANYLAKEGANLIITDLKTRNDLKNSIERLKKHQNIKFVLGRHRQSDFKNRDMILRGPSVPNDSPYLAIARKNKIPIEMDDSLFAKHCRRPIIGVTGTRGKTTTSALIYHLLKSSFAGNHDAKKRRAFLAGNIPGIATLPLINRVGLNDYIVLELSSWQLQGWEEAKISPKIAVITNIYPDHLNYYKGDMAAYINDKKAIYKHQSQEDYLILNRDNKYSSEFAKEAKSKIYWFSKKDAPQSWRIKLIGDHNLENIAAAIAVAKILKIKKIRETVEAFSGIEHRLEFVREVAGVQYINDSTSTTPISAQMAIASFARPIIIILGGSDKGLDFAALAKDIAKYCRAIILLQGAGTENLKKSLASQNCQLPKFEFSRLDLAVVKTQELARPKDIVLFSPACASFGLFVNEYDRGEKFKKIVCRLKVPKS